MIKGDNACKRLAIVPGTASMLAVLTITGVKKNGYTCKSVHELGCRKLNKFFLGILYPFDEIKGKVISGGLSANVSGSRKATFFALTRS